MKEKMCTKGQHMVDLHLFPKNIKCRDGLDSWCYSCRNAVNYARGLIPGVKTQQKVNRLIKIDTNPRAHKNKVLKQKFGLTIEDYEKILYAQNGKCAVCKKPETARDSRRGKLKDLAVDHCHKTGAIRGLLCDRCNTSLGKFEDNVTYLQEAVAYLTQNTSGLLYPEKLRSKK